MFQKGLQKYLSPAHETEGKPKKHPRTFHRKARGCQRFRCVWPFPYISLTVRKRRVVAHACLARDAYHNVPQGDRLGHRSVQGALHGHQQGVGGSRP